mmetsp:Transcript_19977/g.49103  ORF Transcript_19977/g.49103 Transcript_19977/m.49103 type:complete len:208 (+) Transcript_19977:1670-2293(+)
MVLHNERFLKIILRPKNACSSNVVVCLPFLDILSSIHSKLCGIVFSKPRYKPNNPFFNWRGGIVCQQPSSLGNVGISDWNVSLLHSHRINDSVSPNLGFDQSHKVGQKDGSTIAQIDKFGLPGIDKQGIHDSLHNITYKSKVSSRVAVVKHSNGFVVGNLVGKDPWRHVGSSKGSIDRKKPQANRGQAMQIKVGLSNQLVTSFGGCI